MNAISISRITRAITVAVIAFAAAPLRAQVPNGLSAQVPDGGPDPAKVRVRMGPLAMNPTVSLTNFGVDDNIFNEPEDLSPKRDLTFTVTPSTELWLRMGSSWLTGTIKEDLVWYQKYATERAANSLFKLGWKIPANRLLVDVGSSYANSRDRPGYEIDARPLRTETKFNGAVEIRVLSKTFLGMRGDRQQIDFDKNAFFLGTNLRSELNHVTTSAGLTARHQLTPLTALAFTAMRSEDRFDFSSLRDSDSNAVSMSVVFDPFALIKGSATFGYRDFHPRSATLSEFRGFTTLVDLSYTVFGMTRFGVRAIRDLQYSFEANQPYYLETGFDGTLAQQIFGPFDVVGRLGMHSLAYRDRAGAAVQVVDRVDAVRSFGAGIGYHVGKDVRLGFNVDKIRRDSDEARRRYSNFRFGTAVTYGL